MAGPDLSRRSRALEVRDGVLWVGVENAAWAAQLSFLRTELLQRLQAEGATVKAVQFRLARMQTRGDDATVTPALPPARAQDRALAEAHATPIGDPDLANAWRSLMIAGLRRSRTAAAAHNGNSEGA